MAAIPQTRLSVCAARAERIPQQASRCASACWPNASGSGGCRASASSCSDFQDGLLVPLAVVTGLAGANVAASTVMVGGLAEAVAGAVVMGTGACPASQAENQLFRSEIADEPAELDDHPEVELEELEILLREDGLDGADARVAAERIARSPRAMVKTTVEKELGCPTTSTPWRSAIVGFAYAVAATIPLRPYFAWDVSTALPISLAATVKGPRRAHDARAQRHPGAARRRRLGHDRLPHRKSHAGLRRIRLSLSQMLLPTTPFSHPRGRDHASHRAFPPRARAAARAR
jgi:hypothetical protein